jgi:hypothetical protein
VIQEQTKLFTDHKNFVLEVIGSNIIYVRYLDGCELTLEKIKEAVELGNEQMEYQKYFTIVNTQNIYGSITSEAKEYLAKDPVLNDLLLGEAVIVNSLANRILIRSYQFVNKPLHPSKIFKTEIAGIKWLESLGADFESLRGRFQS